MHVAEILSQSPAPASRFHTTTWTRVVRAQGEGEDARQAFSELCQCYWYPLYTFLRRSGKSAHDAEDAVQSFFAWLVETGCLERADPARGRFRTFLLAALKQFCARAGEHDGAAKRRPEVPVLSLDLHDSEQRFALEPCHHETPEKMFEYSWAIAVIDSAMRQLRSQWVRAGRGERFEVLKEHIVNPHEASGRDLANLLNVSEGAARLALHRLRRQFADILRGDVEKTLEASDQIEDELQSLLAALQPSL